MNSINIWKVIHERRANAVIASVILLGAAVSTGLVIAFWVQTMSSGQTDKASEQVDYSIQKLAERLTFQQIFYSPGNFKVFIMNTGKADSITLKNVYVKDRSDSSIIKAYSNVTLNYLNGSAIPDQNLDQSQQGYFQLSSLSLPPQTAFWVKIVTGQDNIFGYLFIS